MWVYYGRDIRVSSRTSPELTWWSSPSSTRTTVVVVVHATSYGSIYSVYIFLMLGIRIKKKNGHAAKQGHDRGSVQDRRRKQK